jgi:hypothetical protein
MIEGMNNYYILPHQFWQKVRSSLTARVFGAEYPQDYIHEVGNDFAKSVVVDRMV